MANKTMTWGPNEVMQAVDAAFHVVSRNTGSYADEEEIRHDVETELSRIGCPYKDHYGVFHNTLESLIAEWCGDLD
jgi:hypothetical protein